MERLKAWSYYYLGWPRPPVHDRRLHWVSEQAFARVIQQGQPVLVALLMPGCAFCETFEEVLKQASDQFAPAGVTVLQVNCAEATGFCRSRHPETYPHVELFMPAPSAGDDAPAAAAEGGSHKVRVNVSKFALYPSVYGLREFLKASGVALPPLKP